MLYVHLILTGSAISMGSSGNRQSDSVLPYDPADRPQPPIPKQNGECNYRPPSVGAEGYDDPQESIYSEPRPEVDLTKVLANNYMWSGT